jgi:hypothetical protein
LALLALEVGLPDASLEHPVCETTPATATPASKTEEPVTNSRRVVARAVGDGVATLSLIRNTPWRWGLGAIIVIAIHRGGIL